MKNEQAKSKKLSFSFLKNTSFSSYSGLVLVLIVFCAFLTWRSPNFLTVSNILNVLRQISVYGIIAAGMAFVIITGGIDLSVGSVTGLSGAIVAKFITEGTMAFIPAVLVALAIGMAIGTLNGFLISRTKIPPFVMTLGTMISLRGICYIVCDGKPIGNLPEYMLDLGMGTLLGIPTPIYFMVAIFIIAGIILNKTPFGRSVYAVGGNPQAAFHAGINSNRVITLVYMISGLFCALAGIILAARNASAQPTGGNSFELEAIAACAIGGISMAGGYGSIIGVCLGALLMGAINNGMNLLYISSYWQLVVKGIIITGSVIYSMYIANRGKSKKIRTKDRTAKISGVGSGVGSSEVSQGEVKIGE
jgi:ribose/xylose/arabinose/galactoside ABC-type transport system permease subunit